MRLSRTVLGFSSDDRPSEADVRRGRVENARRNSNWRELEETALVRRGKFLVHADTDEMFLPYRGAVFQAGSAYVAFNEQLPMSFFVNGDGDVVFLNRQPWTWSEVVARRARKSQPRAPRRTPRAS